MFILKQYLFILYIISVLFLKTCCENYDQSYSSNNEEDYNDEESDADDYEEPFSDDRSEENNSKLSSDSVQVTSSSFIGSNLFDSSPVAQSCFSKNDIALLTIRKDFERILPNLTNANLENDQSINVTLQYFHEISKTVSKISNSNLKYITEKALYDTIGGYLTHFYIPLVKLSYYAGLLKLSSIDNVFNLNHNCKVKLNTNGNGWQKPIPLDVQTYSDQIESISIKDDLAKNEPAPCINFNLEKSNNGNFENLIAFPKIAAKINFKQTMLWLPFKRKHYFNLKSKSSAFILLRYYVAAVKCYKFQGVPLKIFNQKFTGWLEANIIDDIYDTEQFFPALGAVLRVLKTLKSETYQSDIKLAEAAPLDETLSEDTEYEAESDEDSTSKHSHSLFDPKEDNSKKSFFNQLVFDDSYSTTRQCFEVIALVILLSLIAVLLSLKCKFCKKQSPKRSLKNRFDSEDDDENAPSGKNKKSKKIRWFPSIFKKKIKSQNDGEIELGPDSPSIMSRENYRPHSINMGTALSRPKNIHYKTGNNLKGAMHDKLFTRSEENARIVLPNSVRRKKTKSYDVSFNVSGSNSSSTDVEVFDNSSKLGAARRLSNGSKTTKSTKIPISRTSNPSAGTGSKNGASSNIAGIDNNKVNKMKAKSVFGAWYTQRNSKRLSNNSSWETLPN